MKIVDIEYHSWGDNDYTDTPVLFETNDEVGIGPITICGCNYSVGIIARNTNIGDIAFVRTIDLDKSVDAEFVSEITCPYCGFQDLDSWECEDDGIEICSRCDGSFSYSRYVEVSYSSTPLKEGMPTEIKVFS